MQLAVFHVAHALVVADGQRQERGDHRPAVDDIAVEQLDRVGDLHELFALVDLIDEGVDALREIVGGDHFDVGASRRFSREMGRRLKIAAETGLGLHDVGAQDVASLSDQVLLLESKICVAC